MQNECGNVPAHNKYTGCKAGDGATCSIYAAKIFRRKKQGVSSKNGHEVARDSEKKHEPENKKYLEFPEMQKQQLYGK